jgi:phosphate-selective porin
MKHIQLLFLLLLTLTTSAQQQSDLIIKTSTYYDHMTLSKNTSVLFSNGQNKAIADFSKLQNKKTIILKGKGKFLMPGLAETSHLPIDSKIDTLLLMLQQA